MATLARPVLLLCLVVVLGCDQFAAVGMVDSDAATGARDDAAAPGDGDGDGDGPADAGQMACERPAVAVCDPVLNTGCAPNLSMRCAVDYNAPHLAGYCAFDGPVDGGTCLNTGVTESCPARSTCYGGVCRMLCFCDADCAPGRCCSDSLGEYGFRACGDC